MVAWALFQILQKDVEFRWQSEHKVAMEALKYALCNAPALKMLDVSNYVGQIVLGLDTSLEGWGAILQQEDEKKIHHPCRYQSGLWNTAETKYDAAKQERRGLIRALNQFRNYM
jgi:hypothetical protein